MRALVFVLVALVLAAPAAASEQRPTLAELEGELICPTCQTTLDQSSSPVAARMRQFIRERIAAGDTKSEIKSELVADFGPSVLAAPPKRGFNLLAWLLPLAGALAGAAAVGLLVWRWSTRREPEARPADPAQNGRAALPPEVERRLDEELARYD